MRAKRFRSRTGPNNSKAHYHDFSEEERLRAQLAAAESRAEGLEIDLLNEGAWSERAEQRVQALEHFIDWTVRSWISANDEHAGCNEQRCPHARDRSAQFDAIEAALTPPPAEES